MSGNKLDDKTTPVELATFKEAMERALEARTNWKCLLLVHLPANQKSNSKNTKVQYVIKNMLTDFKSIKIKTLETINFLKIKEM